MVFKTDSIGHIVRGDWSLLHDVLFNHGAILGFLSLLTLLAGIALLIVLSLPIGYFLHRKHIPTIFLLFFSLFLIFSILFKGDAKLSDVLLTNTTVLYFSTFIAVSGFLWSTHFNKTKKRKDVLSRKDYIPLFIIIGFFTVLFFLPIRSGHFVCLTPVLQKSFNCSVYKQIYIEQDKLGWFVF